MDIEIYADEIITPNDFNGRNKNFLCIGCVFIPLNKKEELVNTLVNKRCLHSESTKWCWEYKDCIIKEKCKEEWHALNNCEIHNIEIRASGASHPLKKISRRWLNYVIESNKSGAPIRFNILYVDLDNLMIDKFGYEKNHENIYNRFFRTTIEYGLKAFFNNIPEIVIKKVYHDNGSMKDHEYFPYLNLKKLDEKLSENIFVEDTEIHFIESDHKTYLGSSTELVAESHIIQLTDLIIGSITQNIYFLSENSLKMEHAMILRPLIERLTMKPYDKHSPYCYYGYQNISFFPKNKNEKTTDSFIDLEGDRVEISKFGEFYKDRKMDMPPYNPNQQSLTDWFSDK